jgi:hypothetical protein
MTKKEHGFSARSTFSLVILVPVLLGSFVLPSLNLPSPTSHHQEPTTYRRSDEFNLGAHSGLASQALTI